MDIYYMSEESDNGNCAGTKARNDLERVFCESGFLKVGRQIQCKEERGLFYFVRNFFAASSVKKSISKMKDKTIFFQYPIAKNVILSETLKKCAKRNKCVFFIHDLNYLRKAHEEEKAEEIEFLNCAFVLVCHNEKMINKLQADGVTVPNIINLELFDYLLDEDIATNPTFGKEIVYAGNLKKGGFIDEIQQNSDKIGFDFHLYGINYQGENTDKIKFEGNFTPEKLVSELNYSYGLIWDSTTADTCTGVLGKYTRYNNPHKCSLYVAAGLPVIAWSGSAIADFIHKHGIGFTVDSLYDIDKKLEEITADDYKRFTDNLAEHKERVRTGYYARRAIQRALDSISD